MSTSCLLAAALALLIRVSAAYLFVNMLMSVDDAEQYCVDTFGSHLATIRTSLDNERAYNACMPLANDTAQGCSIGLNDKSRERFANTTGWTWFSGAAVTYLNWNTGEPNEWHEFVDGEDCVILWKRNNVNFDYFWNDCPCHGEAEYTQRFLCDEPTVSPTTSPTPRSNLPTQTPTQTPSSPSKQPTGFPSISPSESPSSVPSISPTSSPSGSPTRSPTQPPSESPSVPPTNTPPLIVTIAVKRENGTISSTQDNVDEDQRTTTPNVTSGKTDDQTKQAIAPLVLVIVVSGVVLLAVMCGYIGCVLCYRKRRPTQKFQENADVSVTAKTADIASTSASSLATTREHHENIRYQDVGDFSPKSKTATTPPFIELQEPAVHGASVKRDDDDDEEEESDEDEQVLVIVSQQTTAGMPQVPTVNDDGANAQDCEHFHQEGEDKREDSDSMYYSGNAEETAAGTVGNSAGSPSATSK